MKQQTVALLFGGKSNEYEVSCRSGAVLLSALREAGWRVLPLGITREGVWYLYRGDTDRIANGTWVSAPSLSRLWFGSDGSLFTDSGRTYLPDVIFPAIHGQFGEDGRLQGFLETWGVPYVGCGTECSVRAMNKVFSKEAAVAAGVPTLPWVAATRDHAREQILSSLQYPLFIKPARSGSSVGAARVDGEDAMDEALRRAFETDDLVLAEPLCTGRELEVAVLDDGTLTVSRVGEVIPGAPFYDYQTKYKATTAQYRIPSRISAATAETVRAHALRMFRALGCRHLARMDFFFDGKKVFFNEVNTLPGFTSVSMYPTLMADSGIPMTALVTRLCRAALG